MTAWGFQAWCYNRYTLVFQQKLNLVPIFCQIKPCQTNLVFQPTLSNKNLKKKRTNLSTIFCLEKTNSKLEVPIVHPPGPVGTSWGSPSYFALQQSTSLPRSNAAKAQRPETPRVFAPWRNAMSKWEEHVLKWSATPVDQQLNQRTLQKIMCCDWLKQRFDGLNRFLTYSHSKRAARQVVDKYQQDLMMGGCQDVTWPKIFQP